MEAAAAQRGVVRAEMVKSIEMPHILLPVTHLRQSSEATCLAACARMALAYAGDVRKEQDLIDLLGIDLSYGAPASRLLRLERLGFMVKETIGPTRRVAT